MSGETRLLSVIAWFSVVFGGIGFIGLVGEPDSGGPIVVALVFVAGGILLLRTVSTIKKTVANAAKYKKYIDIVVNQNVKSIDSIASAVGLPYDVAAKDLQDMINVGYLEGAYIHQGNREITWKQQEPTAYAQAAPQTTVIHCLNCGANNVVVVGSVSKCEYCEKPINA